MKHLVIVALLAFVLSSYSSKAQGPAQLQHENRVYLNDGNTYVQKSLPLYLKFSTSPTGQNYDLKSKATPKYADPMYLDTEGINYVRSKWAVDPATGKTVRPTTRSSLRTLRRWLGTNYEHQIQRSPALRFIESLLWKRSSS